MANLVPWKPGQSGNPSGRPKAVTTLLKDLLEQTMLMDRINPGYRTNAEMLAQAIVHHALNGNSSYMKEIMDRIDGPIPKPEPVAESELTDLVGDAEKRAVERKRKREADGATGGVL